jgi:acetyltransferase-like isoleucine patch superfamily enzyme
VKTLIARVVRSAWHLYESKLRPKYYAARYPNLKFGRNVIIRGNIRVGGSVRVQFGDGVLIENTLRVYGEGRVTIGANVYLNGPYIACKTSISIGDDSIISDCGIVDTDFHNLQPHLRRAPLVDNASAPIRIETNTWIGARAWILKGVVIGKNSVVGQACVVREVVPDNVVVIGNPAFICKRL